MYLFIYLFRNCSYFLSNRHTRTNTHTHTHTHTPSPPPTHSPFLFLTHTPLPLCTLTHTHTHTLTHYLTTISTHTHTHRAMFTRCVSTLRADTSQVAVTIALSLYMTSSLLPALNSSQDMMRVSRTLLTTSTYCGVVL